MVSHYSRAEFISLRCVLKREFAVFLGSNQLSVLESEMPAIPTPHPTPPPPTPSETQDIHRSLPLVDLIAEPPETTPQVSRHPACIFKINFCLTVGCRATEVIRVTHLPA